MVMRLLGLGSGLVLRRGRGGGSLFCPSFASTRWPATAVTVALPADDLTVCEPTSTSTGSSGVVPTRWSSIVTSVPGGASTAMRPSFVRTSASPFSALLRCSGLVDVASLRNCWKYFEASR